MGDIASLSFNFSESRLQKLWMLRIQASKSTMWWTDSHWGGLRPSEHKLMVLWKKKTEYWVQKTMSFACNLSKLFQIFKSFSTKCHMSWSKLFLYRQKGLKKKKKNIQEYRLLTLQETQEDYQSFNHSYIRTVLQDYHFLTIFGVLWTISTNIFY